MSEGIKTPKIEVPSKRKSVKGKPPKVARPSSPQPSTSTSTASTPSTSSSSSQPSVYSHIEGIDKIEVPPKSKKVKVKPPKVARPSSPQPSTSTSTASTPSTSSSSSRPSVYSHIEGIEGIPQLRPFRPGRRRSLQRTAGIRLAKQYENAIRILEPIFAEETRRQEEAASYVAAAIEHFADTLTNLADKLEGKPLTYEHSAKYNKLKQRQQMLIDKAKEEHPEKFEEVSRKREKLDEEEVAKRLQEEVEAAIIAITTGDKKGEKFPSLFTEDVIQSVLNLVGQLPQDKTTFQDKKPENKDPAPKDKEI